MGWIDLHVWSDLGARYEIQIDEETGRRRHRDRKLAAAMPDAAEALWRDGEPEEGGR